MPRSITGVAGKAELFPLAAILALPANSAVNIKSLFWDHATDKLKSGPEGARVDVVVTGAVPVWSNMYGTSTSGSQDEETADAPVQFGDADNFYGDDSQVVKVTHSNDFEGVYDSAEAFWIALRTASGAQSNGRLLCFRFFPEGAVGGKEVIHGVVDPRGRSNDFPRDDFYTFSLELLFKTRRYEHNLPAVYPPVV